MHRSLCLDLARLADADEDAGSAPLDPEAPARTFIVREWAAAIAGLGRTRRVEAETESVHP